MLENWNVLVTVHEQHFVAACELLEPLGLVKRTNFYNVLVMRVDDVREFLEMLRDWAEKYPDTNEALSRVAPVQRTFTFHSAAEFETQAKALALEFAKELAGKRFYVRMHRRGWKDELGTPTEERVIGSAVYDELERRGTPASVDFEHPDAVLAVETLGNRAGVSLWTRVDLERYPFLKLD